MASHSLNLFRRVVARNPKVHVLKVLTLALAFATSLVILLFSLNEFGYDRFHNEADKTFRVLRRNDAENHNGNRLSNKIPSKVFERMRATSGDISVARVVIMNGLTIKGHDSEGVRDVIHAADRSITKVFTFNIDEGSEERWESVYGQAMVSASMARKLFGESTGDRYVEVLSQDDTLRFQVALVYRDFPANSHDNFQVLLDADSIELAKLGFDTHSMAVYGRVDELPMSAVEEVLNEGQTDISYVLQPLPEIYFGKKVLGEVSTHGDAYSILILCSICGLIFILALTNYVILTTLTLPHRSKELAVKKLAGTTQLDLYFLFFKESLILGSMAFGIAAILMLVTANYIQSILEVDLHSMIVSLDPTLILVSVLMLSLVVFSPIILTVTFIRAAPSRLLGSATVTFPRIKQTLSIIQLAVGMVVLVFSLVMKRQISYSLVKEPGRNNDQVLYLDFPKGLTHESITQLREGWRSNHPNIVDVFASSHLPHQINSRELNSEFYSMAVDPMFPRFFDLNMKEGNWYGPDMQEGAIVVNDAGIRVLPVNERENVVGVIEDFSAQFNLPKHPLKFFKGSTADYNYLFIRVLEVDIRRTVNFLSTTFDGATIHYLDNQFQSWLDYQDRLNRLSDLLAIVAVVLSGLAIYALSISFVREKQKVLAVHKIYGAQFTNITMMLIRHFGKEMGIALVFAVPFVYILTVEVLRNFAYATSLKWYDSVLPVLLISGTIICLSAAQALRLNIKSLIAALKS